MNRQRLGHDARFLNLWMVNAPFNLDCLSYLPRYVSRQSYQTVLDETSGHDHLLLAEKRRAYFGIQCGCAYFHYNTLLFGWKISPFVYQSTGLVETNFFRSSGILCLLYIDCRNGQLQEDLNRAPYSKLQTVDEYNKNVFVLLMMFLFPF